MFKTALAIVLILGLALCVQSCADAQTDPELSTSSFSNVSNQDSSTRNYPARSTPSYSTTTSGSSSIEAAQDETSFQKKSVHDLTSFAFYSKSGIFRVYKLGKVIEEKKDNSLRTGSLKFLILGPGQARIIGNNGAGKVKLLRTKSSVSFVETTPLGGEHIFTVYDEWDGKAGGFRATYIRTVPNPILGEVMRTTYRGHAK